MPQCLAVFFLRQDYDDISRDSDKTHTTETFHTKTKTLDRVYP